MPRYFIQLSYKGTSYHAWQKQDNALSVQEVLEKALMTVLSEQIETIGCGRTDTGVHAKEFFAHFDSVQELNLGDGIPFQRLIISLNALIGYDIAVQKIIPVHTDAHARFDATSRSYEYHIHFQKDPFKNGLSFLFKKDLNIDEMNRVSKLLLDHRDFECFSKSNTQVKTFLCTITEAKWEMHTDSLVFHISANRFLRNMVRAIVGTLLMVGTNELDENGFLEILNSGDRSEAGTSVPADGLYLVEIKYPFL